MLRLLSLTLLTTMIFCLPGTKAEGQTKEWPAERVELNDGRSYEGLVESESLAWVYFAQIQRPRGRPMFVIIRPLERSRINRIVRLPEDERDELRSRIGRFRNRARIEAGRIDAVELGIVSKEGNHYYHYEGNLFALDSTADEATTRKMVVRIDQVFTAYRQIIPPRREPMRTLRLVVLGSKDEYREFIAQYGLNLENNACYIRNDNTVVASSEIARFAAELKKVNAEHDKLRRELEELETQLQPRLKQLAEKLRAEGVSRGELAKLLNREKYRFQNEIKKKQTELARCDRRNAQKLDQATGRMFKRLYHEAFHAYLENYVYPSEKYAIPLWLNEGLATMFEEGQLESDTLRVDAPNHAVLKRLKADLAGENPLSVEDVLKAGESAFLVSDDNPSDEAMRHYAYSWGLAYYLAFERDMLQNPELDKYLAKNGGTLTPGQRFEVLLEMPLWQFEERWRKFVLKLN